MSQGKVVQIIGAVVDVEFPRESVPKVYDALKIDGPLGGHSGDSFSGKLKRGLVPARRGL